MTEHVEPTRTKWWMAIARTFVISLTVLSAVAFIVVGYVYTSVHAIDVAKDIQIAQIDSVRASSTAVVKAQTEQGCRFLCNH